MGLHLGNSAASGPQTSVEMAKALGVSAGYVNLLEDNERSLSLRVLMTLADH